MNTTIQELKSLYSDGSKHSRYQNIPVFVKNAIGYSEEINEDWRGDTARLSYIEQVVDWEMITSVADIGANTGFFSLTLAEKFKEKNFLAVEINPNHCALMTKIKNYFTLSNFKVANSLPSEFQSRRLSLLLHFNVLHHLGSDFGSEKGVTPTNFVKYAIDEMRDLSRYSEAMLFQIGYNLWGDKNQPIVDSNKQEQMLLMVAEICRNSGWEVCLIGIYDKVNRLYTPFKAQGNLPIDTKAVEKLMSEQLELNCSEFYKRPIFYLKNANRA